MNNLVFRHLSYGVYVISTYDEEKGRHTGCIANSVMQVTSSPATVAVSINHDNHTNGCVKAHGRLAVGIVPEGAPPALIGAFGFSTGRDTDKFATIPHTLQDGLAIPDACMGFFTAKVIDTMETSTHTVFLVRAEEGDVLDTAPPMTYAYYHNVVKGKSPKNAPTYIAEEAEAAKAWVCTVCGYVYDGAAPFEELSDDYVCPICGVPKSRFEKR